MIHHKYERSMTWITALPRGFIFFFLVFLHRLHIRNAAIAAPHSKIQGKIVITIMTGINDARILIRVHKFRGEDCINGITLQSQK